MVNRLPCKNFLYACFPCPRFPCPRFPCPCFPCPRFPCPRFPCPVFYMSVFSMSAFSMSAFSMSVCACPCPRVRVRVFQFTKIFYLKCLFCRIEVVSREPFYYIKTSRRSWRFSTTGEKYSEKTQTGYY